MMCLSVRSSELADPIESVSLLQTAANKKQAPQKAHMKPVLPGPPWADVNVEDWNSLAGDGVSEEAAAAFASMKEEGEGMLDRTVLALNLTDKQAEGDLAGDGLRFSGVGKLEEQDVDLLVELVNKSAYDPGRMKEKRGQVNGLYKGFVRIFLKAGTTQQIKMSVVKNGTTEPVNIPLVVVSFFSLGGKGKKTKFPTAISDCNDIYVSELWAAPNLVNETGGCGGTFWKGTGQLKGKKSDPASEAEVDDDDCPNSFVVKYFDAKEMIFELNAGDPPRKRAVPFIFKVGPTPCDVTWAPPPPKEELRALAAAKKAAAAAAKKVAAKAAKQEAKNAKKEAVKAKKAEQKAAKKAKEAAAKAEEEAAKMEAKEAANNKKAEAKAKAKADKAAAKAAAKAAKAAR